jgi:hypothetical protein
MEPFLLHKAHLGVLYPGAFTIGVSKNAGSDMGRGRLARHRGSVRLLPT